MQVSRHGNRGSNADYVMDPYPINDTDYWPYGVFGLTPVSRATQHALTTEDSFLLSSNLLSVFFILILKQEYGKLPFTLFTCLNGLGVGAKN